MSKLHNRENDTVAVETTAEKSEVALREEAVLAFWEEHDIFNKSLQKESPKGEFIFYDGPPFATGLPHYGHILAGTIKDAIPRFKTMQGYHVPRKWGWDCHGLPLENLIEKKLGLATKRDIEAYGVQNFNEAARDTVMEYADDWAKIVPRMGRWADMEDDYKTMDPTYTESVWSVFKALDQRGLVFEGFKSMHLCPRCGTTLSNFEVNQGYKDIKDIAVTVKLPLLDEAGNPTDTSLLVWTTTPWTLPGNMASAVHKDFIYVKVQIFHPAIEPLEPGVTPEQSSEFVVLAKDRLSQLGEITHRIVEEIKGEQLIGRRYEPPFPFFKDREFDGKENAWKIWHADYVEIGTEGTGAVHIAPAYGEEDLELAKANNIPIVHHVDTAGHFMEFVTDFECRLVKPKDDDKAEVSHLDTDIEVLKKLQEAGKIFKKENITHSYPHCWRCDTPLLNYATTSWFVNVPKIKDDLVVANNTVHWVPEHVGRARFGNWLEGARDWAVSRQRYWGAPLPIWKHPTTGAYKVFGTLEELQAAMPQQHNRYFVVRHAEAESNLSGAINAVAGTSNPLTAKGRVQSGEIASALAAEGITKIVHSGLARGRETAELVAAKLGLSADAIVEDARIIELQVGAAWEGKTWEEFNQNFSSEAEKFTKVIPGAETRQALINRAGAFLYAFDATHQNERVLIVGHGSSIFALQCAAEGADYQRKVSLKEAGYLKNAEVRSLPFVPMPHNDAFELDYHRPYIDRVIVVDENGDTLERIQDVFDCWFESGSMPYGQQHYLGEALPDFNPATGKGFPAQFIAEGLDQTRGWFYSLIVLGVALFGKSPFENVIVNGLALAEDGRKMSKSLRNYPDPMELVDRQGADAMRYYLLTSPIIRAEDLNFSEKEVAEIQRKNIGRLHNVLAMYELYADGTPAREDSPQVLDRWIVARLNQLIAEATAGYEAYELDRATRPLADFIDDVSVWYLRRSRERLKSDDAADKQVALGTLRFVLRELAKVMAPVMPFYAEYLYRAVRDGVEPESVHLCDWPMGKEVNKELLTQMKQAREIVTFALEARTSSKINVRQPVASISGPIVDEAIERIILDEVNAKNYLGKEMRTEGMIIVSIDPNITPELKAEGDAREFIRAVQDMRKQAGLMPSDIISLTIGAPEAAEATLLNFKDTITKTVGATALNFAATDGQAVVMGEHTLTVQIEKVR